MVDVNLKVPALEKLADYAASGIGAVAGPMLATWKARQDAKARLIGAQTEADSLRMIAGAQADARRALVAPDETGGGTLDIGPDGIAQRIEFQERKRQANIASVVRGAADDLGDKEVPDHEPDPDWTARFFDCVQDVSSEDIRTLWAKVLSGEVEAPGRTSLRTLDILKNMKKRDAQIFKNACDYVIDDFIYYPQEFQTSHQMLGFRKVTLLQNIGLVYAAAFLVRHLKFTQDSRHVLCRYQDRILRISTDTCPLEVDVPDIILTDAGKELCRILEHTPRIDYLQSFSKFLRQHQCELSCAPILQEIPDGSCSYSPHFTSIEPKPEQPGGAAP